MCSSDLGGLVDFFTWCQCHGTILGVWRLERKEGYGLSGDRLGRLGRPYIGVSSFAQPPIVLLDYACVFHVSVLVHLCSRLLGFSIMRSIVIAIIIERNSCLQIEALLSTSSITYVDSQQGKCDCGSRPGQSMTNDVG